MITHEMFMILPGIGELTFPFSSERLAKQFLSDFIDMSYITNNSKEVIATCNITRDPFTVGEVK